MHRTQPRPPCVSAACQARSLPLAPFGVHRVQTDNFNPSLASLRVCLVYPARQQTTSTAARLRVRTVRRVGILALARKHVSSAARVSISREAAKQVVYRALPARRRSMWARQRVVCVLLGRSRHPVRKHANRAAADSTNLRRASSRAWCVLCVRLLCSVLLLTLCAAMPCRNSLQRFSDRKMHAVYARLLCCRRLAELLSVCIDIYLINACLGDVDPCVQMSCWPSAAPGAAVIVLLLQPGQHQLSARIDRVYTVHRGRLHAFQRRTAVRRMCRYVYVTVLFACLRSIHFMIL